MQTVVRKFPLLLATQSDCSEGSVLNAHKFIFICGLHRSGTSPLFKKLRSHPQISGFHNTGVPEDEGQHLQSVIAPAKAFGGPGRFGFAPEAHLTETSLLAHPQAARQLFREWSNHWNMDKPYLLEKSPPNLIRTRFLEALFPNSYFIVLLRHPVAVSLATMKWTDLGVESLLDHWFHCHQIFDKDRAFLRNVLVIRYEDLVATTRDEMSRIYEFLRLSPLPAESLDAGANSRYFKSWRETIAQNPALLSRVQEKFGRKMNEYGYSFLPDEAPNGACRTPFANSSKIYPHVVVE